MKKGKGYDYATFEQVMHRAKTEVSSWGGLLYFVYIPDGFARRLPWRAAEFDYYRDRVRGIVESLDISAIDLTPAVYARDDPLRLYDRNTYHLSVEGNAFVAEQILTRLEQDRAVPPPRSPHGVETSRRGAAP